MSTRSFIGMEKEKEGVKGVELVYCHFDGYPSGNGEILLNHYTNPEKIEELLSIGDLSSLGAEIGSKHDFNESPNNECNFYGRDRGETDISSNFVSYDKLEDYYKTSCCEYMYIFKDNKWYITDYYTFNDTLLTTKICEDY